MLLIETKYGNFGNFKDLLIFMKHEQLTEIHQTTKYIGTVVNSMTVTLEEVEKLAKGDVL